MKFLLLIFPLLYSASAYAQSPTTKDTQEFKIVTIVESLNYRGNGESSIIDSQTEVDDSEYAAFKTDGSKAKNRELKGKHVKVDNLEEIKLQNIFDGLEVKPRNVASNDAMISSKINSMLQDGWRLTYVTSAVESDGGDGDLSNAILISRLFFSR
ncbi:hypothetical protein SAMN04489724_2975 [Algoriphagus locisalis]|uniref:DUF4177 domain-containing protein n=1 Tax=Algoriphagus locisalis TaxID=305507 RepID=A0A1I7C928_9BACT|nr:hypothetical protein [Algoriphagus locisalis]SFT95933.1 hypothetical protein SAMN04489724_2975 [Algoriphagus locisalis]